MRRAARRHTGAIAAALLVLNGCSRDPSTPTLANPEDSSLERASPSIVPKDASRQAAKLLATIADRPECEEFRTAILEASAGSPAAGTTQMAFIEARKAAREAGCLVEQ